MSTADGFAAGIPADCEATDGPASPLVHRHDERLDDLTDAVVRGALKETGDGWVLAPASVLEPMGPGKGLDGLRPLRRTGRATDRYPQRRGPARPEARWDRSRPLAAPRRPA